jgi:uncharacterized membrane protein YeaQ/YmgE (transglycosylase-associated protein family)
MKTSRRNSTAAVDIRRNDMSGESLLTIIVVGVVAGWLAGQVVQGGGFGLLGDLILGIAGAFLGGFLFPQLHLHLGAGIVATIISAAVGAILLLLIIRLVNGGFSRGRWGGGMFGRRW